MGSTIMRNSVIIVYLNIIAILAFPVQFSDLKLPTDTEIVDGPREFYLPIAPRRSRGILPQSGASGPPSDVAIYAKLYLLRTVHNEEEHSGTQNTNAVRFRAFPTTNRDETSAKLVYPDGISFPDTSITAKRSYHYSTGRNPAFQNEDESTIKQSKYSIHRRKVEERSAEHVDSSHEEMNVKGSIRREDSLMRTEEDDEYLLQQHSHHSTRDNAPYMYATERPIPMSSGSNRTSENLPDPDVSDRFLIDVPSSKHFVKKCPEGERADHLGKCRVVISVKSNSGQMNHPNMPLKNERNTQRSNSKGNRRYEGPDVYLARLLRSVAQLEKTAKGSLRALEDSLVKLVDANESRPQSGSNGTLEGSQ